MKTISMLMVALLLFSVMPIVAAEDTEVEVVDAGITPDSPLYGLERAMERVKLAFTRDKVKRVKYQIELAEERLAEVEEMIEEDNEEAAEEAQELHDELINETEEEIEEMETNGDEETAEEDLIEAEELQLRLMEHSTKVAFVKNRILERMSQDENVSEEKIAHLNEVFGKIITKAQEAEQKMDLKRENIRTKYKVLSEMNESELTERENQFLEKKKETEQKRVEIRTKVRNDTEDSEDEEEIEEIEEESDEDEEIEEDDSEEETSGNGPGNTA